MAYEHKDGSFTLFKNDKKETENQPDYKGQGKDLDGNEIWVSAWIKTPNGGGKFMSCSIQLKQSKSETKPGANVPQHEYDDGQSDPF